MRPRWVFFVYCCGEDASSRLHSVEPMGNIIFIIPFLFDDNACMDATTYASASFHRFFFRRSRILFLLLLLLRWKWFFEYRCRIHSGVLMGDIIQMIPFFFDDGAHIDSMASVSTNFHFLFPSKAGTTFYCCGACDSFDTIVASFLVRAFHPEVAANVVAGAVADTTGADDDTLCYRWGRISFILLIFV